MEGSTSTDVERREAQQEVEVHLEELGQHSWWVALANTLTGSFGSAQFRFVVRPRGEEDVSEEHEYVGATFPVMRLQDLDDQREPNAWLDLARDRWRELDAELVGRGWRRSELHGPHWWSAVYDRGAPT